MRVIPFEGEQWLTKYEHHASYNLTDTCLKARALSDLPRWTELADVVMDYGDIAGSLALREQIVKDCLTRCPEQVVLFNGASEANRHVMDCLLEPGDHVLTFSPTYQQFVAYPKMLGCVVDELPLDESFSWNRQAVLECIHERTKLICLNRPNNPTGSLFDWEELVWLANYCQQHQIILLVDEVYLGLTNAPSMVDLSDWVVVTNSLSKSYGFAGVRLGWAIGPDWLIEKLLLWRDYSLIGVGPLADAIGRMVLETKVDTSQIELCKHVVQRFCEQNDAVDLVFQPGSIGLLKVKGFDDSAQACATLVEQTGVLFIPGSCFGLEGTVRISYTTDPLVMEEGLERFGAWLKEWYNDAQ